MVQAQSSTPISQVAEPLWSTLLSLTNGLPSQIDTFQASSLAQLESLRVINSQLLDSNAQLQISNDSLTASNKALTISLQTSQEDLATSEAQRSQLQKDLNDSIASITRAQGEAKKLEYENTLLKVGCVSFGIGLAAVAAYEGGRALKWW
jgi:Trp operon repressor